MAKSNLAIIGNSRLAHELAQSCRDKGLEASFSAGFADLAPTTSLVIETSAGDRQRKQALLQKLDEFLPANAVIVSSCLGFGVTELGSWLKKPERLVGFATFHPLKDRKVIELARGLRTGESAANSAAEFFQSLGKETVQVKDTAGLTFPRILSLIINEAARALEEGVASAEEIDLAMRLGVNYPQGPLKWADQIGLDEVLAVLEGLLGETGDDRYRAAPLLKRLVTGGFLGETSGRGFYNYNENQVKS